MTRYEAIKNMTEREMMDFLCDLWLLSSDPDSASACEVCPMQHYCTPKNIGWKEFLNEEWDDKYTTGINSEEFEEGWKYGKQHDSNDFQ